MHTWNVILVLVGSICVTGMITNGISSYMFARGVVKTATTYQLQWLAGVDSVFLLVQFVRGPMTTALRELFQTDIPYVVDVYIVRQPTAIFSLNLALLY